MNINRFVGAVVGVWIVRVALNWTPLITVSKTKPILTLRLRRTESSPPSRLRKKRVDKISGFVYPHFGNCESR